MASAISVISFLRSRDSLNHVMFTSGYTIGFFKKKVINTIFNEVINSHLGSFQHRLFGFFYFIKKENAEYYLV